MATKLITLAYEGGGGGARGPLAKETVRNMKPEHVEGTKRDANACQPETKLWFSQLRINRSVPLQRRSPGLAIANPPVLSEPDRDQDQDGTLRQAEEVRWTCCRISIRLLDRAEQGQRWS